MHRIDGPGVAAGNQFTEGDPGAGVPATVVTADFQNAVQEELCSLIEGAGIGLDKPDNQQVLAAVKALCLAACPVGTVLQGYYAAAPSGFLLLSGQLVSRTAYARLFDHATAAGLVVAEVTWAASAWTMFGAGDGSTTFRLPDLRGEFIRGLDDGRGVDAGRTLGSAQADLLKLHGHPYLSSTGNANTDPDGGMATDQQGTVSVKPAFTGTPYDSGSSQLGLIGGSGGAETRPRNAALRFVIRV